MLPETKFKISGKLYSWLEGCQNLQWHFDLEDHLDILDYLGIRFTETKYGNLKLTKPQLIDHIIEEVMVNRIRRGNHTPSAFTKILHRYIKEGQILSFMPLLLGGCEYQLFRSEFKSKYNIWSAPMCHIFWWRSTKTWWFYHPFIQISSRKLRPRYHHQQ